MNQVGVEAMRQGDLRDRRAGLGTLRQHLPLELGIVTSPLIRLGVLHGVHLRCLVDTILAGHQPRFKVTWPDAYVAPASFRGCEAGCGLAVRSGSFTLKPARILVAQEVHSDMAKPPVIEDAQMRHAFKVAAVSGQTPARDVALLHVLYGTGMTATELAQLEVADVLDEGGAFRRKAEVRPAISFNGRSRPVFWVNPKVCAALDGYFATRLKAGHGVTAWRSRWRGLVELGPVFLTSDGCPFALTTRKTGAGNTSRSCEVLTQVIRKLHDQAGIEAAGASAARRTFGVRLKREGYDLRHIREVLGLATLSAAKALCDSDPVDLGRIVARVL